MDITILAQTSPKQSCQDINLEFFNQYAVCHNLTSDEREFFYKSYRMETFAFTNPVVTMRRRVDLRDGQESGWQWEYFDCFETLRQAVAGFADSVYWKLENSKHLLHKQAVEYAIAQDALRGQLIDLEHYKTFGIREKYNDMYIAELKSRRLYSKASQGTAPQDVIDQIQAKLKRQHTQELAELQAQIDQIHEKLGA